MKKITLLMLSIMALATVANAQNQITDGTFETTAAGNFTLGTTSYVNIAATRNIWGGQNTATTDNPLPLISVIDDAGNKCASYTRGATTPGPIAPAAYLYQRLSATAGVSASKTYKLTFKAKSITANRSGFFYIRNRSASKFALRADWAYTGSETYGWCWYKSSIPTTWTEYSQNFVFSNSISGSSVISSTQPPALASAVPFTDAELNDLVVCFYSNSASGGTVYIDDVVFEEVISTTTAVEKITAADTKIVIVEGRALKIQNPYTVTVFDAMGRIVESVDKSKSTITLKNSGVYLVKAISQNGHVAVQKIIVK